MREESAVGELFEDVGEHAWRLRPVERSISPVPPGTTRR
jgi:hypothetical protein